MESFADGSSDNLKFSKAQLSNIIQSGGVITDISGIDNFINFLIKMENAYLKESSNIDTKKINKSNRNNLFIDPGLNIIDENILKEKSVQE